MRKRINGIITLICFMCLLIGAAAADKSVAPAIILIAIGSIGVTVEGFYWRGLYER